MKLHLYRGTTGSEIAYLLRLLLNRLGLAPDSPKLRVVGASASLQPDNPKSQTFLSEFFGSNWTRSQIIPGRPTEVPSHKFKNFLDPDQFVTIAEDSEFDEASAVEHMSRPGAELGNLVEAENMQLGARMLAACANGGTTRATRLSDFGKHLFGDDCPEETRRSATRGLLKLRAICGSTNSLPSFRMHWFFKNIEGLWACSRPGCQCNAIEMSNDRTSGRPVSKFAHSLR